MRRFVGAFIAGWFPYKSGIERPRDIVAGIILPWLPLRER